MSRSMTGSNQMYFEQSPSFVLLRIQSEAELQYTSWWDGSGMKFKMGGMDPTCSHPKPDCDFFTHNYFCT